LVTCRSSKLAGYAAPALALALAAADARPAPTYDLAFGARHEDNVTRAEAAGDQEHDTGVDLASHVSGRSRIGARDTLTWELGFGATWWTRFEDLSELAGDAGLRVRHAFADDFEAPWIELAASATALAFLDSDIRNGGSARAGFTAGRRLGARLDARVGYAYVVRRALEDRVFDLERHEAFGQVDVALGRRWLAYAGVGAREGEFVSTAGVPNAKVLASANAVSRDFDTAFGDGPAPVGPGRSPRRSYQIDAVVLDAEVGLNYLVGSGLALDVATGYVQAYGAGDNQYNGYSVNAHVLWQFH
jgi:hypothetical protein